jgi:hypothetical protein
MLLKIYDLDTYSASYFIFNLCLIPKNLELADIIKHNGRLISHAVKKLVEDYESDTKSVMFQILAMLFEVIDVNFLMQFLLVAYFINQ